VHSAHSVADQQLRPKMLHIPRLLRSLEHEMQLLENRPEVESVRVLLGIFSRALRDSHMPFTHDDDDEDAGDGLEEECSRQ
jgi:hypothetical protein